jgi:hypothetical protein
MIAILTSLLPLPCPVLRDPLADTDTVRARNRAPCRRPLYRIARVYLTRAGPPGPASREGAHDMAKFLFSYRMAKTYVPGRPDAAAAWAAWFQEIRASVTDRGNPVFESASLGDCGDGTGLGGYSLIIADDLDAALALAKGCPALAAGGGVEVGPITEVSLPRDGGSS